MADVIRCDGECGKESPDPKTGLHEANHWMTLIVRPLGGGDRWRKHRLCPDCAKKNVFLPAEGQRVSDRGFASDVLR